MKKNTAITGFTFGLVSATDNSAITTGTPSGYYTLDGGSQGSISDTPTHEGNGQWSVDLTSGETNGDVVGLLFTHASAINVSLNFLTDTVITSEVVGLVWDETLTGQNHNIPTSAGRRLRGIQEFQGYALGSIWVDVNGTAGIVEFENGTVENPVDNIEDANTLSSSLGINRFQIAHNTTITLEVSQENQMFSGKGWTLDLASQSVSNSTFVGATVSGIATGAIRPSFIDCDFNTTTLPPSHLTNCGFADILTAGSAGEFFYDYCHSMIAGTSSPVFDFGSGLNASNLNLRSYSGGIEIQNMGAGTGSYNMSLEGNGQLIINANCSATSTVAIRGNFTVTDNASGSVTLSDNARFEINKVVDAHWDETLTASNHNVPTSAGRRVRQLSSSIVTDGTARGAGINGNQIQLAEDEQSMSDVFDPSIVLIVSGTGFGQSRRIIEYDGSTKTATVNRNWKTDPDNTSEYIIIADPGGLHVNEGLAQGGDDNEITLNTLASEHDNSYLDQTIFLVSGMGEDQARIVTSYNGTSKVATINRNWHTNPDTTTGYLMLPNLSSANIEWIQGDATSVNDLKSLVNNDGQVIIDNLLAETPTAGGTNTIKDILLALFSMSSGRFTKVGDVITFYDDDNTTVLYSFTVSSSGRS